LVDAAVGRVPVRDYAAMFADFSEEFMVEVGRSVAPRHYVDVYRRLGESMQRWAAVFV
jgi:hypothetical protein